jgi:hypothetical protein
VKVSREENAPELPAYSLDVQALELGAGTKAVGLELIETESREPLRGSMAAEIWAAAIPALAGKEPLVVDFFSHLDRVRDFCALHMITFRESASRCIVLTGPPAEELAKLFSRFENETFGLRCGAAAQQEDAALEQDLSHRGLDAYESAYRRYTFCGVCEPADGWMTMLSDDLWPSEIIRRLRPALQKFDVYLARPQ